MRGQRDWRNSPPPRAAYHHAKWHDWWVCRACGAVVEDWPQHDEWHDTQGGPRPADAYALEVAAREAESAGDGLRERANAEGNAVVEASGWWPTWRADLRQAREMLRLRPREEA